MDRFQKEITVSKAILERRSIRRFKPDRLTKEQITYLLNLACAAPSAKNSQPWRFVVVMDEQERERICDAMEQGLKRFDGRVGSAWHSLSIMRQAPVNIFIFASGIRDIRLERTILDTVNDMACAQSIGACIENMLLAATGIGLGSLWICDIFYAYEELMQYFGKDETLVAAVSLGIPDEAPGMRPRKPLEEIVEWR
ncbi:MAG: nitroreductase [Clostridiales bacterium]|jgi:nitroreductase|nr:nitroreductase [Clostridiales bacterium]